MDHFSHGYITISQKDKRHKAVKDPQNSYQVIDFKGVCKITDNSFYEIESKYPRGLRDTCAEFNLKEGENLYMLVAL